jgi:D-glycero-D-manno-heptose 1,7-bisphosphate phosphatase
MEKFIFLDRDGVINKDPGGWTEHGYVTRWEDFHFIAGATDALKMLSKAGFRVIIISNQAGVGKGYFSQASLDEVTRKMIQTVSRNGGNVEDVFYCTHRSDEDCPCRKPKSGLLEQASKKYNIDVRDTYFVGDSKADIEAGMMIGAKTVLVFSGKTSFADMKSWDVRPDHTFDNLLDAVKWLMDKENRKQKRSLNRRDE